MMDLKNGRDEKGRFVKGTTLFRGAMKGKIAWNKDRKMSDKFKEKCRQRQLGKHLSEITKQRLSETMKKKVQEGFIPKSIFIMGHKINNDKKLSENHKYNISKSLVGRKSTITKESKIKISNTIKILMLNPEYKKMISNKTKEAMKRPEIQEKVRLRALKRNQEGRYSSTEQSRNKNKIAQTEFMKNPMNRENVRQKRLHQIFPVKDTKIEIKLQQELTKQNIIFISHKSIIGQPDIFIKPNICIFADGNYWHNFPYGNERDKKITNKLEEQGYKVLRFWESQINNNINECINKIKESLGIPAVAYDVGAHKRHIKKGICVPIGINDKARPEAFKRAVLEVWNR